MHFFARVLWSLHRLRLSFRRADSNVLADEMSDIIDRTEGVQRAAKDLDES
jgi:hypothetical protein